MLDTVRDILSHLYQFDELIRLGGYTAMAVIVFAETGLLVGFCLPGDSLLVTAGLIAAAQGTLNIWLLIALLSVAAIMGDSVGYAIGYHLGPKLFRRDDSWLFKKSHVEKTQRFYAKYGGKTIVLARFVPIVRTFAPTVAGMGRMDYRRFLMFNVLGGIGWVAGMLLAGYCLGQLIPDLEHHLHWVILVVITLSILPIVREWWMARRGEAGESAPVAGESSRR